MLLRMCGRKHTCLSGRMEADSLQGPGTMDDNVDGENQFEPYLNYLRKELDNQDPILIIGIIVALAVIVITFGKFHIKLSNWVASKLASKLHHGLLSLGVNPIISPIVLCTVDVPGWHCATPICRIKGYLCDT